MGLPGEDVFAGVRVGCCAKLSDDYSVLCQGTNICIRLDKPEQRDYIQHVPENYKITRYLLFINSNQCNIEFHLKNTGPTPRSKFMLKTASQENKIYGEPFKNVV